MNTVSAIIVGRFAVLDKKGFPLGGGGCGGSLRAKGHVPPGVCAARRRAPRGGSHVARVRLYNLVSKYFGGFFPLKKGWRTEAHFATERMICQHFIQLL